MADQIYEVRVALEGLIGRKLAETITPDGLKQLAGILEEMASAAEDPDVNPYTSLNLTYHVALARLTGNAKLHETYSRLVAQLTLFRRRTYLHDAQSMALSLQEHRAIFDALAAHDPKRAAALLGAHAEDSRRRLHASLLPTDTALSDRGTMSAKV
ncbi:GntR family transcriptional regulator [Thiocapsa sp.]|uniref:GntR family transcriptional regulator n=1 Tax=Thiocapsa sp. TaxID=2024551 RepID=UPI003593AE64